MKKPSPMPHLHHLEIHWHYRGFETWPEAFLKKWRSSYDVLVDHFLAECKQTDTYDDVITPPKDIPDVLLFQRTIWVETWSKPRYSWVILWKLFPYSHKPMLDMDNYYMKGVVLFWDRHIQHHIRLGYVGIVGESTCLSRAWGSIGAQPPGHPTYLKM